MVAELCRRNGWGKQKWKKEIGKGMGERVKVGGRKCRAWNCNLARGTFRGGGYKRVSRIEDRGEFRRCIKGGWAGDCAAVIAAGREKISVLRIEFLVFTLSEVFRATLVDGGKMVELVVSIRILDI